MEYTNRVRVREALKLRDPMTTTADIATRPELSETEGKRLAPFFQRHFSPSQSSPSSKRANYITPVTSRSNERLVTYFQSAAASKLKATTETASVFPLLCLALNTAHADRPAHTSSVEAAVDTDDENDDW